MNEFGLKAKRGRPKKSQEIIQKEKDNEKAIVDKKIQDLLNQAVELFAVPYDDRDERPLDAPSISFVAEEMNTSRMRVRKMLITAGFYSSEMSRHITEMSKVGLSVEEICKQTGLGRAAVHSYLPFQKIIYKLENPSYNAQQCKLYALRKNACENLVSHLDDETANQYLWDAIIAFENYSFTNEYKFKYSLDGDNVIFEKYTVSKDEIEQAFHNARSIQKEYGCVAEPSLLACRGANEIYTVFLRIGACCR